MVSTKSNTKTFDFSLIIKEKKLTPSEFVLFKKSFLEGLMITKEWLINIKKNNPEYTERIDKVLSHINLETVEYELRVLDASRDDETKDIFKFLDSQIVARPSVSTKSPLSSSTPSINLTPLTPPTRPDIVSKEQLKNEIQLLYQQEENYDICLTKCNELLQHPDLTADEKQRYQTFYTELLEWVNLKNRKQEQVTDQAPVKQPEPAINISESRGTSISQLRTSMLKELHKLRQIYIDEKDKE